LIDPAVVNAVAEMDLLLRDQGTGDAEPNHQDGYNRDQDRDAMVTVE
jgi:hypothetical protein